VAPPTAPLRAAAPPAPAHPATPLRAAEEPAGRGRLSGALILAAIAALIVLAAIAWSRTPTLYVRPDGPRAADPPPAAELRDDLRRVALRLSAPVTIRRR
jgi:hypothetical protein